MCVKDVKFAVFDGSTGNAVAIVLLAMDGLLVAQTVEGFELWRPQNLVGRKLTWRDRTTRSRMPLETLVLHWHTAGPGDLPNMPEHVSADAPIYLPTKEEFARLWQTGKVEGSFDHKMDMNLWIVNATSDALCDGDARVDLDIAIVTPTTFRQLREQTRSLARRCKGCCDEKQTTTNPCLRLCQQDRVAPDVPANHHLCLAHLTDYVRKHIAHVRSAKRLNPNYRPPQLLCVWCCAVIDVSTLLNAFLGFNLVDDTVVSDVLEFFKLLA